MKKGEFLSLAIHTATTKHHGQFDKGGNPYVLHVLAVMNILQSDDEELNCIALLHDVVEDTKTTFADLKEIGFTDRIIDGVRRLTKMQGQTLDEYKQLVFESPDAMMVKMADLTHNSDIARLKGISDKDIERMAKYHRFYLELKQRLSDNRS